MKIKIKKDKYQKARGGKSTLYWILCEGCGKRLYLYQKDGGGSLYRLYIDRIMGDKERDKVIANDKLITCSCGEMIGYKYIYKKENRQAIKLFTKAIQKEIYG